MKHSFDIEIAKKFQDANIATLFENLCFWIAHNKANNRHCFEIEIDGKNEQRTFTYNSISAFCKLFPYWSRRQIENYLVKLRESNLIIKSKFNKTEWDRTSWYCLVDETWLKNYVFNIEKNKDTKFQKATDTNPQLQEQKGEMHFPKRGNAGDNCIVAHREEQTNRREDLDLQTEKNIPPNEKKEMDSTEKGNICDQTVECIPPNGEMHSTKQGNAFHQTGEPIPDINKDINTATADTANLKKVFSEINPTLIFDAKFYSDAVVFMHTNLVSEFKGYCEWLYLQVKDKNPKNLRHYYYSVFCLEDTILSYLALEKQVRKKERICPLCDIIVSGGMLACPECALDTREFENKTEVAKQKKYRSLPTTTKKQYDSEKKEIIKKGGIMNYVEMLEEFGKLDEKYNLTLEAV